MDTPRPNSEAVEKATAESPRRAPRRKAYRELSLLLRRHIPESFELHGPDSDEFIAKDCDVHRITVLSMVVHKLTREIRRVNALLVMRGASVERRKPIEREHGLEVVSPKKVG